MVLERELMFRSDGLELEGLLTLPGGSTGQDGEGPSDGVVICHPHPLYGGTMENMVVKGICTAVVEQGMAALRFNFRGVGLSKGGHDNGIGEVADVLSAVGWLRGQEGVRRVHLAGYSFGSMMALKAALRDEGIGRLACVALPVDHYGPVDMGPRPDLEVLLVGGEMDDIATVGSIEAFAKVLGDRGRVEVVPGADHFFGGRTRKVGEMVAHFLSN